MLKVEQFFRRNLREMNALPAKPWIFKNVTISSRNVVTDKSWPAHSFWMNLLFKKMRKLSRAAARCHRAGLWWLVIFVAFPKMIGNPLLPAIHSFFTFIHAPVSVGIFQFNFFFFHEIIALNVLMPSACKCGSFPSRMHRVEKRLALEMRPYMVPREQRVAALWQQPAINECVEVYGRWHHWVNAFV